jgi:hypothetical protein
MIARRRILAFNRLPDQCALAEAGRSEDQRQAAALAKVLLYPFDQTHPGYQTVGRIERRSMYLGGKKGAGRADASSVSGRAESRVQQCTNRTC